MDFVIYFIGLIIITISYLAAKLDQMPNNYHFSYYKLDLIISAFDLKVISIIIGYNLLFFVFTIKNLHMSHIIAIAYAIIIWEHDLRYKHIPDILTMGLIWSGILSVYFLQHHQDLGAKLIIVSMIYIIFNGINILYENIFAKQGIGRGDIKYIIGIAIWLDFVYTIGLLYIAFFSRLGINLTRAFGPYLSFYFIPALILL